MRDRDLVAADGMFRIVRLVKRWLFLVVVLPLVIAGWASPAAAASIEERVEDHFERALADGLEPTDFHHLMLAFAWRDTLPDRSTVERGLDRLAASPAIDPLMADELRLLRARLAVEAGRPAAARELFRAMGGLVSWWAHGPVALEELADFGERATLQAIEEWRPVAGTDALGWVRVSGLGWPARRQLLYLATTVHSDSEQPVALRVGAAQVARVWVNGMEALTTPQPLARAADQAAGGAWLRSGHNRLVVAVASENDEWWVRVRLTAPDGSPLPGAREVDAEPVPREGPASPPPEVRTLEGEIRRTASVDDGEGTMALAAYTVERRPGPLTAGAARAACRAARRHYPAEARLLEWMTTSDPGTARTLLEDALGADPSLHWARIELGRWLARRALYERAAELLAEAAGEVAVRATALDIDADRWGSLVLPELARLSQRHPRCVEVAVVLARQAAQGQRFSLLEEALERLGALVPGSSRTHDLREEAAHRCGDAHGLRSLLEELLNRDPNRPDVRMRLARLVAAMDLHEAAGKVLRAGLDRCPDHAELLLELARLEHTMGNDREAVLLTTRLLDLRPQDRRAQRLLELMGAHQEDLDWLRTLGELWELADAAPDGGPAVTLLEHVEVRFLPAQLTEERVQRAILVADAERADSFLSHTLPYVPERQRLRVLAARILRRDGSELSARQSDTPRLSDPQFNLYYDTRLRVLRFGELEDGDLIEISYLLAETAEANETGPYKGGFVELGRSVPVRLAEIELSGPENLLPAWEIAHLHREPERSVDDDGTIRLRWRWRDLPAVPADVPPAPRLLVSPHLVYSNHPEWGDLADWYGRHVAPRVRASRQVEEVARRLTGGAEGRRERIARIYRFVTDDIRYVGLELGEHRFRPFSAGWVLSHRFGDCKDKAALLVAMLGVIEVPARMVLVRTADQGPVVARLGVLESFNHAIVYLPEDDLWLDGTATGHDPFRPPAGDQGAHVLVIDGVASRPQTTPVAGAGAARYRYRLQRDDGGAVRLDLRTEATGDAAARQRASFAGSSDPRRIERWLQGQFPSAQVVGEPVVRMTPGRDPAVLEVQGLVARGALLSGGGIPCFPGRFDIASGLVPSAERRSPLLVALRPDLEWTMEVDLGRASDRLPPGVHLDTPFGTLDLTIEATDVGYRVNGRFHLESGVVKAADAGGLRDFLVAVERHLRRPLEVP